MYSPFGVRWFRKHFSLIRVQSKQRSNRNLLEGSDATRYDARLLQSGDSSFAQCCGAIAQLGERVTGSHEVGGSIPPSSTNYSSVDRFPLCSAFDSPSSEGPSAPHRSFRVASNFWGLLKMAR